MTFASPTTGAPVWRAWQIPHSHTDLRSRRLFSETWAEATFGLMGRTPDHVAGFFTGFAAAPTLFATADQKFADNVVSFYERARDQHLTSATRLFRRRSTAANPPTSSPIRRSTPASSRSATTAS